MDQGSKKQPHLKPQTREVLTHLLRYNSITPAVAQTTYGIWRLAACVHELRRAGYRIKTELRSDAKGHRYSHYSVAF